MFAKDSRILIADDMRTMRIIVKKTLVSLGFNDIVEAEDGQIAWARINESLKENKSFHLIISDWNMPNLSGVDLLKVVRKTPAIAKVPFLLLTAESDGAQVMEAAQSGVSAYIVKPFNQVQLQEKLVMAYKKHFGATKNAA